MFLFRGLAFIGHNLGDLMFAFVLGRLVLVRLLQAQGELIISGPLTWMEPLRREVLKPKPEQIRNEQLTYVICAEILT